MSQETNKQVVISFLDAFSNGRSAAALDMFIDSATWWTAGRFALSGTKDKAALAEALGGIGGLLKGPIRVTPKAFTVEGDRVAVEAESHAERKDGKIYNNQYHFLFEVRDGKIAGVREYFDTMHANEIFCMP
jgi:hypothetical protein